MPTPDTVVDASVVVKWVLPEPSRREALRLLRSYRDGQVRLIAPTLLISEFSNVLCKRYCRGQLTAAQAIQAFRLFQINAPILVSDREPIGEAIRLAMHSGQAVYDCLYLALAIQNGCEMVTADRRFHAAMAPRYAMLLHL